jgi:hypothetical protein
LQLLEACMLLLQLLLPRLCCRRLLQCWLLDGAAFLLLLPLQETCAVQGCIGWCCC